MTGGDAAISGRDELAAERDRLRYAREALARERAAQMELAESLASRGGDDEAVAWLYRRAYQLDDRDRSPLFFGRIDGPEPNPIYIGRRHVPDGDNEPVVIDWRTDMAARFYQATPSNPLDVTLRRRYGFSDADELTGFDDEDLVDTAQDAGLSAFIRREIERSHYGPMRDIVATIQPDQHHLVRMSAEESLVVQGGPGTGKTAVGLHRAAFLLYEDKSVRAKGVLVVGPNATFLNYISRVLPALGEVDTVHRTIASLVGAERAKPEDEALAVLKGDARMAAVVAAAVLALVRRPDEDLLVTSTSPYTRVHADDLSRLFADLIAERRPFATARAIARERVARRVRRLQELRGRAPSDADTARLARSRQVKTLVESVWPAVKPKEVLSRLLSDPAHLARCADGVLTPDEQRALLWPEPSTTGPRARWTAADHVLMDEISAHLAEPDRYGHIVLDEAQDLSAMQLRMVGRRCAGAATLLGDLAQQTTAWSLRTWPDVLRAIGLTGNVHSLQISYRVPSQILDLANRLLAVIAPDLPATTSPRSVGDAVAIVAAGGANLAALAAAAARTVRTARQEQGSVGVIVADHDLPGLRRAMVAIGIEPVEPDLVDRERRVALVPAGMAKGLEFDHVVLVEPARIAASADAGNRLLYVALTRAISRLTIVHSGNLPPLLGLTAAGPVGGR